MKSNEEAALHDGDGACTGSEQQQVRDGACTGSELVLEEVFVTSSSIICHENMAKYRRIAGHESFLSKVRELGGELARVITEPPRKRIGKPWNKKQRLMRRCDAYRLRVRRGAAYWRAADSMIGTQAVPGPFFNDFGSRAINACSAGEFRHHLRCHLQLKVDQLLEERKSHCEAMLKAQEQAAYDRHRAEWLQKYADVIALRSNTV